MFFQQRKYFIILFSFYEEYFLDLCPHIPAGAAELFYGRKLLVFYSNKIPNDGLVVTLKISRPQPAFA